MKAIMLVLASVLMVATIAGFAAAEPPLKVKAFVCPVIASEAMGMHNPNAKPLGDTGTYTVGPPTNARGGELMVPIHATNMDGAGIPGGPQAQPGDKDYTAIWAIQED